MYPIVAAIQIVIFIYLLFFFSAMTTNENGINNIIKYNQIPGTLVVALILHMLLMVFERYVTMRTPFFNEESKDEESIEE